MKDPKTVSGGLVGANVGRSRLSMALDILCARSDHRLNFQMFDTATMPGFEFRTHVSRLRAAGFDAITVTHPYKTDADALSDHRDGYPETLGAANLLRFDADGLRSFNTDYTGMLATWSASFAAQTPGRVAIAGAGGVARAITAALIKLGASDIQIWDSDADRAVALCQQIDPGGLVVHAIDFDDRAKAILAADGLINATPLGMREYPGMAFHTGDFSGRKWAFDAVYTPINTVFLTTAKAAGLTTISGFELFKHMAVRTYAVYTNSKINPADAKLLTPLSEGL